MNQALLEKLLEKYYNGETTAAETAELKKLLEESDLPEEYMPDRELLLGLEPESIPEPSGNLEERIMAAIAESERMQHFTGIKRRLYLVTAVAASLIILITSYFLLSGNYRQVDTFSDPLVAYNETVKALHTVSEKLNTGYENLDKLGYIDSAVLQLQVIGETTNRADNELKKMKILGKSFDALDVIRGSNDEK